MEKIIPAARITARHPTDTALMDEVLQVYKPPCRYLTAADTLLADGTLGVASEFSVPQPFYIENTGHFNAVEFVICLNQMMYYAVAKAVKEGMLAPFTEWQPDDFWKRQLTDFLIVGMKTRFRRPVAAQRFHGEGRFVKLVQRDVGFQPLLIMDVACRFWDDDGGRAEGEIKAALVSPPTSGS
ncbi:FcoT family thioesterase [Actinoplanes sp. NPDC049802]|uniref:FcoT family thioesterase n=1 Tax=Actinoplanes sp. NPDC049802 TaxID=3154742 RepID=UPI0033E6DB13